MLEGISKSEPSIDTGRILRVVGLKKHFSSGLFHKTTIKAVDGLSFEIQRGEALALVGESGCGKSTVGRCISRLSRPTAGNIYFKDRDVWQAPYRRKVFRKSLQVIFQDPDSSLDPRMKLFDLLCEPLKVHGMAKGRRTEAVAGLMEELSLSPDLMGRYPHELSGGQRQRIGIARALSLAPELIIADEAGASLDLLAQAQILDLMKKKQGGNGTAYLFISHNLSAVRRFAERILVLYLGRCVEMGTTETLMNTPAHPYTQGLLSASTGIEPWPHTSPLVLKGEIPGPGHHSAGCRFQPRCPGARPICSRISPEERRLSRNHSVWCHF